MKKIRKAIIPAAGLGTRFLPATKAMPKEMLPIVDRPTIEYIIEEAVEAGIEDIIIVTGKGKRSIEDHFDRVPELEKSLEDKGKLDLLEKVNYSSNLANIHYIRQKEPKGLGHAVWCARHFIGDEPFAVLLGDDIVRSEVPCIKQMIEKHEETYSSIIGVQEVPENETHRYGIVDPLSNEGRLYQVKNFVEKPAPGTAPSNLAIMGRYILTPEIFKFLEEQEVGAGGEIQLTDAIAKLNKIQRVFAYKFEGKRYDVGEKIGFVKTTIEFALQHEDLREEVISFIKGIVEKEEQKSETTVIESNE
ncbi:UTP--glucose-1-phosphate uridylyltransferase GalU [Pallidibacillus pasinlerensis]|uniref:UTP--glucose-1-phosphate uridylyltransferase n=1 Tax=Pallidibacillus pasinlerensis TaxID=2703818 RepID=A0ABX0A914_9BACI|nr:UTP--glucose-1-phosphate uridylyltransferase GalU [Pallidibacillus pasinlerensis]NCU17693.1 UTP--glucose-1-phosphate uridylyltransferase GalU [Pallidibacillus pasinlerensis]